MKVSTNFVYFILLKLYYKTIDTMNVFHAWFAVHDCQVTSSRLRNEKKKTQNDRRRRTKYPLWAVCICFPSLHHARSPCTHPERWQRDANICAEVTPLTSNWWTRMLQCDTMPSDESKCHSHLNSFDIFCFSFCF